MRMGLGYAVNKLKAYVRIYGVLSNKSNKYEVATTAFNQLVINTPCSFGAPLIYELLYFLPPSYVMNIQTGWNGIGSTWLDYNYLSALVLSRIIFQCEDCA